MSDRPAGVQGADDAAAVCPPELLDDAALIALGDRAAQAILEQADRELSWQRRVKVDQAAALEGWAGWRLAITGLVAHGQLDGLAALARWAEQLEHLNACASRTTADILATAVAHAGDLLVDDAEGLQDVLDDPRSAVREAIVRHLDPARPAHHAALERLLEDHELTVRQAACQQLGRPWSWWQGLATEDPSTGLAGETAEALAQLFTASLRERIAMPEDTVHALIDQLPPDARRRAHRWGVQDDLPPFARPRRHLAALATLSGEALAELAWQLLEQGGGWSLHAEELLQVPAEQRCAALSLLGARMLRGEHEALQPRAAGHLAHVIDLLGADSCDPGPLLMIALGGPLADAAERGVEGTHPYAVSKTLSAHPLLHRYAAIIEQAQQAGRPGAWAALSEDVYESALGARRLAQQALAGTDQPARQRAIKTLLTTQHDPEQDGSVREAALRFYRDPQTRAALLACEAGCEPIIDLLRETLEQPARLDAPTLALTMRAVARVDGGLAWGLTPGRPVTGGTFAERVWQALRTGWQQLEPAERTAHAELFATVLPDEPGLEPRDQARVQWLLDHPEHPGGKLSIPRALHAVLDKRDAAVDAFVLASVAQIPHPSRTFLLLRDESALPPGLRAALEADDAERVALALRSGAHRFP